MRKLAFVLSTALIATPAFAVQMEGTYLSSAGGLAMQSNITYHGSADTSETGHRYLATENKPGTSFDLAYGFQTEDLRAEVSALYLQNKIKKSLMRSTYFDINGEPNMGSTKAIGLMTNGMYDFNSEADFTPYIGFGLGIVRINLNVNNFQAFTTTATVTPTQVVTTIAATPTVTTTSTSGNTSTTTTSTPSDTKTVTTTATVTPIGPFPSNVTPLVTTTTTTEVIISTPQVPGSYGTTTVPPGPLPALPNTMVTGGGSVNGTHLQLAYQPIIGVSYKLTDYFKVTADYRYLRALSTTFKVMNAGETDVPMKGTYTNHRLMLGLTAFF